jgi:hypothetical protein
MLTVDTGRSLDICFEIVSLEEIFTESCNFFFVDQQRILSAQIDFSRQLQSIPKGRSLITVTISSVDLAAGPYQLNTQIFAKGGRDPIIHGFGTAHLNVSGPQRMWCSYRMPVTGVTVEDQRG